MWKKFSIVFTFLLLFQLITPGLAAVNVAAEGKSGVIGNGIVADEEAENTTVTFDWSVVGQDVKAGDTATAVVPEGYEVNQPQSGELATESDVVGTFTAEGTIITAIFSEKIEEHQEAAGKIKVAALKIVEEQQDKSDTIKDQEEQLEVEIIDNPKEDEKSQIKLNNTNETKLLEDTLLQVSSMQDDVTLSFQKLNINGIVITNEEEAENITPEIGDTVKVFYGIAIEANKEYGVGSSFTFQLPPSLLTFDESSLKGTLDDGDIKFEYETDIGTKTVTVALVEGTIHEGNQFNGGLNFSARFSEDGAKDGLEQELEIPVLGHDSIKFPFTFTPTNTGKSMYKEGIPVIENGERYINWEVWTNREGVNLEDATLNDTLGEGHELDGDITVEKYFVGLSGVGDTAITQSTATAFPVNLDKGRFAYKLTYKTKVTREPDKETEVFSNKAVLQSGETTLGEAEASASHAYGIKLDKEVTDANKYNAKWQIKYNYFGSKMNSKKLTDTVSGSHKIKKDTVKVYNVSVDAAGKGTKDSEVNPQPNVTLSNEDKTFELDLQSPNGEAYIIEYETELIDEYVTDGGRIENTVSYENVEPVTEGFNYSQGIFDKTRRSIDFDKKEITWTITVNAEKEMKDFIIEDDFKNYTEGGTRQKLVNPDNPFTISNGVATTVPPTLKGTDGDQGFTLKFGNVSKNFVITYKTSFDILPNGAAYDEYKNTAIASWTGIKDGKDYSVEKEAVYKPSDNTGNNGYKNGSFDHVNQEFNWNLAVNINKQNINGAKLVDEIEEGHKLVFDSIKVHKLILDKNDEGTLGDEVTEGFTVSDKKDQGFTITFTVDTTDAYIITYQTIDSDDIIGNKGENKYENTATFTTIDDQEFELKASTTVQHANELIDKKAQTNANEETITWTVDVNQSHSAIGEITLSDKVSENQLILPETFKIREILMNNDGGISHGEWEYVTPKVIKEDNNFTLDLGNLDQRGYQVEYKTFFLGGHGDKFSNEASINYTGGTTGTSNESNIDNHVYHFNDSDGTITSERGNIKIHKVGGIVSNDSDTGETVVDEQVNLAGVTFTLWNKAKTVKLYEETTDEYGELTFEGIRYGKYVLEENTTPDGYKPLESSFEILLNDDLNILKEEGKELVVVNELLVHSFKVQKVDESGDPLVGAVFKLQKEDGTDIAGFDNLVSDDDGWVIVNENLEPGKYQLIETKAPAGYKLLGDPVAFEIDAEQTEIKELNPISNSVNENSVTLIKYKENNDGNLDKDTTLEGAEFTLYHDDGTVVTDADGNEMTILPTDENGELLIEDLAEGKYYFLETKAPSGYQLDRRKKHEFEIKNGESAIVEVGNKVRTSGGGGGTPPPTDPDPEDPNDPDEEKPEEPGEEDPEDPTDPEDPDNPEDPDKPGTEDPDTPDPEDPADPNKPGEPNPEDPDKQDPDTDDDTGLLDDGDDDNDKTGKYPDASKNKDQTGKTILESNDKNNNGSKLPQTGEDKYLYMIILGSILVIGGAMLIFRRKKGIN